MRRNRLGSKTIASRKSVSWQSKTGTTARHGHSHTDPCGCSGLEGTVTSRNNTSMILLGMRRLLYVQIPRRRVNKKEAEAQRSHVIANNILYIYSDPHVAQNTIVRVSKITSDSGR
nr:hypothetical protein CFP56_75545 [Quercus suber]